MIWTLAEKLSTQTLLTSVQWNPATRDFKEDSIQLCLRRIGELVQEERQERMRVVALARSDAMARQIFLDNSDTPYTAADHIDPDVARNPSRSGFLAASKLEPTVT